MKALLLAGGKALRLHPFTKTRPKPIIPIANRTILERNLIKLREAGVTSMVVVTEPGEETIRRTFGDGSRLGVSIEYAEQKENTIGSAILAARKKFVLGQYILLVYADILATENIFSNTLAIFNRMRAPIATVCLTTNSTNLYGNVYLDEEMRITRIVEKPSVTGLGNYVLGGVFLLPNEIFDMLEGGGTDIIGVLEQIIEKYGVYAAIWEKNWIDINYPWSILQANKMVMDTWSESTIAADVRISPEVTIEGPVIIESGVRICEGVVIRGPVKIGRDSFIGNNTLIREYTAIGAETVVGFGTELKNSIIFGKATIGRISYIGDSVVGEGALIGSCTMTINLPARRGDIKVNVQGELVDTGLSKLGAFIGDNATVGASNSIGPGTLIDCNTIIDDHITFPGE